MSTTRLHAWLQLFRLPNLLTVPGDPLVGFVIVAAGLSSDAGPAAAAVAASLLFYVSGLLLNDIVDLEADRAERPTRPLPSGRVSVKAAGLVAIMLQLLGLGACFAAGREAVVVGVLLLLTIHVYNHVTKHRRIAGPLAMGLCRGLSVALGAAAAGPLTRTGGAWPTAAGFILAYIASVTAVARRETVPGQPTIPLGWLSTAVSLAGFLLIYRIADPGTPRAWCGFGGAWGLAFLVAAIGAYRLHQSSAAAPQVVGTWIGALLLYQASMCMAFGQVAVGVVLLILWPAFRYLAKWFYSS